jgi:hypothetical protein
LRKADFLAMGGLEERFQTRGGGLVNLDFFQTALARPELEYVMMLGEGTFHQVHGGVATNARPENHPWDEFHAEYVGIRGRPFDLVRRKPFYMGRVPQEAFLVAKVSSHLGMEIWKNSPPVSEP